MIQVRKSTYRGTEGYSISGYPPGQRGGWPVKIFTLTESSARHIAAKVKAGLEINTADFEAQ